jgi:DNA-binding MarR family transcriptional regulator
MTGQADLQVVDAWRELRDRHARVSTALDKALQDEHRLTTTEFDVLEHLATAPEHQQRMQDLSDAVHLSQSALSRLVGRLEEQDLVTRCICADDRRGIYAQLLPAGRDRFDAARTTHRDTLSALLGE